MELYSPPRLDRLWGPPSLHPNTTGGKVAANHSPPPSVEVKEERSYTSTPQYVFMEQRKLCSLLWSQTVLSLSGNKRNAEARELTVARGPFTATRCIHTDATRIPCRPKLCYKTFPEAAQLWNWETEAQHPTPHPRVQ